MSFLFIQMFLCQILTPVCMTMPILSTVCMALPTRPLLQIYNCCRFTIADRILLTQCPYGAPKLERGIGTGIKVSCVFSTSGSEQEPCAACVYANFPFTEMTDWVVTECLENSYSLLTLHLKDLHLDTDILSASWTYITNITQELQMYKPNWLIYTYLTPETWQCVSICNP